MSLLLYGDCLDHLKDLQPESVDLIFCDLPYGQTSCKWDCIIDLDKLWEEFMRIKKLNTPIIMTCTTKFGVSLINSAPKKCPFRYDLVWCKSSACGFLSAKKMPMRKHEMIYVFYEKLPFYDLSSHKHKFVKGDKNIGTIIKDTKLGTNTYATEKRKKPIKRQSNDVSYEPPLPTSLVKEDTTTLSNNTIYGNNIETINPKDRKKGESRYDPPLPTSLVKEVIRTDKGCNGLYGNETGKKFYYDENGKLRNAEPRYDPPLPTSLVKEDDNKDLCVRKSDSTYGNSMITTKKKEDHQQKYDPPLPTSLIKEDDNNVDPDLYGYHQNQEKHKKYLKDRGFKDGQVLYEPPLPNSLLEVKSTRGKHSTEKPVDLMKWILKYYSKEDDVILDPTMGSGSMGVACLEMKRNFIGMEMDEDIFNVAYDRLNPEI